MLETEYVEFDSEELKNKIRKKMTLTSLAHYLHPSSVTREDAWRDYLRYYFRRGRMPKDLYELIMEIVENGELEQY